MVISDSLTACSARLPVNFLKTFLLTSFALSAFAANSILCRMALETASIDPLSFTAIRIFSGALIIGSFSIVSRKSTPAKKNSGNWLSALVLVLYATGFSFAYMMLSTGTGALILFGFVQATMLFWGIMQGERPKFLQYCGMLLALAGLIVLVLPELETPSLAGACLMALAGISWGIYSIRGQGTTHPVAATGENFIRALPLLIPLLLFFLTKLEVSTQGALIAMLSGGVASGVGYVIWYQALTTLSTTQAATALLFVPALAALGGICFLGENISMNLIIAGAMIICGAGCFIFQRS